MRVWKAVCIEKCPHGLGGGVGISSSRYPAPTLRDAPRLGSQEPGAALAARAPTRNAFRPANSLSCQRATLPPPNRLQRRPPDTRTYPRQSQSAASLKRSPLESAKFTLAISVTLAPFGAASACDALIGTIITKQLGPAIEQADCLIPGLDKPGHKLVGVCYDSAGIGNLAPMPDFSNQGPDRAQRRRRNWGSRNWRSARHLTVRELG